MKASKDTKPDWVKEEIREMMRPSDAIIKEVIAAADEYDRADGSITLTRLYNAIAALKTLPPDTLKEDREFGEKSAWLFKSLPQEMRDELVADFLELPKPPLRSLLLEAFAYGKKDDIKGLIPKFNAWLKDVGAATYYEQLEADRELVRAAIDPNRAIVDSPSVNCVLISFSDHYESARFVEALKRLCGLDNKAKSEPRKRETVFEQLDALPEPYRTAAINDAVNGKIESNPCESLVDALQCLVNCFPNHCNERIFWCIARNFYANKGLKEKPDK